MKGLKGSGSAPKRTGRLENGAEPNKKTKVLDTMAAGEVSIKKQAALARSLWNYIQYLRDDITTTGNQPLPAGLAGGLLF